jgi:hypothetical protein
MSPIKLSQFVMHVSKERVISYLFPLSTRVTKFPLEIIYSDVWGPAQTSVSGHRFYVSFLMLIVVLLGSIYSSINLMSMMCFFSFKLMLNAS